VVTAAELAGRLTARRNGQEWRTTCPSHADRNPSLDFRDGEKGIVFTCRAGCSSRDVVEAFRANGVLSTNGQGGGPEQVWTIRDSAGVVVAEHVLSGRDASGKKLIAWRRGGSWGLGGLKVAELPLYGAELLRDSTGMVVVTEGEKAADAARVLGLVAVGTVTGAATCPGPKALQRLRGREVALWPDNDDEGRKHMDRIARGLQRIAARVGRVVWPEAPPKGDAADFAGTAEQVLAMVRWDEAAAAGPALTSVRLADATAAALLELDRFSYGDFSDYVPTGISTLDRRLGGGLRRGQVSLLGAPTGGAKSTVLQIVAMKAALQRGPALLVSPEMGAHELAEREVLRRSAAPKWRRSPWRSLPDEIRRVAAREHQEAAGQITAEAAPLYIL
jgi:hypothetical protein